MGRAVLNSETVPFREVAEGEFRRFWSEDYLPKLLELYAELGDPMLQRQVAGIRGLHAATIERVSMQVGISRLLTTRRVMIGSAAEAAFR